MNYSSLNLNAISSVLYPSASKLSGNFNISKLAVMIYFGCKLPRFCLITCNLVCSDHPQCGVKPTVCANYRKPVYTLTLSQSQKQPTKKFSTDQRTTQPSMCSLQATCTLQLTTPQNTITYHNALFVNPKFCKALFLVSLGAI